MSDVSNKDAKDPEAAPGLFARIIDSDMFHSFLRSRITVLAAIGTLLLFFVAFFAPLVSPHDPFDLASVSILDARVPPFWMEFADPRFPLGTDDQGRDIISAIFYGMRISLIVGICSVFLAAALGITLGLVAGYMGGRVDAFIMRIADIQLTFPAILIALLVDGAAHGIFGTLNREVFSFWILIFSIALSPARLACADGQLAHAAIDHLAVPAMRAPARARATRRRTTGSAPTRSRSRSTLGTPSATSATSSSWTTRAAWWWGTARFSRGTRPTL